MSKCLNCGADLRFDPGKQLLKCDACDSQFSIDENEETISIETKQDEFYEHICPQCGGSIFTTTNTAATFCSYCGSSVVLENRLADFERPDGIVPFRITKEEANQAYLSRMKKAVFAPKNLRADTVIEKTRGIYMPYKIAQYHAEGPASIISIDSHISGEYVIKKTIRDSGDVDMTLSVSHDALSEFSDVISEGINPYRIDEAKPYSSAYLSGFYADKGDLDDTRMIAQTESTAQKLYKSQLIHKMVNGQALQKVESIPDVHYNKIRNVLCPVWFISNQQSDGSVSYAAVNGQTGEVAAEIPIDKKQYFVVSAVLCVVAYIVLMISTLSFTPHNALSMMGALAAIATYCLQQEAKELYIHNKEMERTPQVSTPTLEHSKDKNGRPKHFSNFRWLAIYPLLLLGWLAWELFHFIALAIGGLCILTLIRPPKSQIGIFSRAQKVPKSEVFKFTWKPIIATVFSAIMYVVNPVHDVVQYVCALIVFVLTLWSFLDIIVVHNKIASRKPAQLMKRGGDENA